MNKIKIWTMITFLGAAAIAFSACGKEPAVEEEEIFVGDLVPLTEEEIEELESNEEFYDEELQEIDETELEEIEEEDIVVGDTLEDILEPGETGIPGVPNVTEEESDGGKIVVEEAGTYREKYKVATYIYQYGHLPSNYMTTEELKEAGWDGSSDFSQIAQGASRGGDLYGNENKMLPEEPGVIYYQCDVNTEPGKISQKILIYNQEGVIYYSGDNGKTFEQVY